MNEQQRIETEPELVRVFLRGGIIVEGMAHVHAGAYQSRVSDLLNRQAEDFLPLTDVTYQVPGSAARSTGAFLVHLEDIVAVDLVGGPRGQGGDAVASSTDASADADTDASTDADTDDGTDVGSDDDPPPSSAGAFVD